MFVSALLVGYSVWEVMNIMMADGEVKEYDDLGDFSPVGSSSGKSLLAACCAHGFGSRVVEFAETTTMCWCVVPRIRVLRGRFTAEHKLFCDIRKVFCEVIHKGSVR